MDAFYKKRGINSNFFNFDSSNPEERFLVDMFGQITDRLKQKYNYSNEDVFKLWNNDKSFTVPVAIFSGKLSPAEALAKFLKENIDMSYREIAVLIKRNERGIWANYKRATKKMPWPFDIKDSVTVPASIFNSEKSILESLVFYLKEAQNMRNKKIAQLLNKNPANIWTVYSRAKKKVLNGEADKRKIELLHGTQTSTTGHKNEIQ